MNSELRHQLYGGEISDHLPSQNNTSSIDASIDGVNLSEIYNSRVKGRASINTTGLAAKPGVGPVISRDPVTEKLENNLFNSFQKILNDVNPPKQNKPAPDVAVSPENEAMDNIRKALEELKSIISTSS
jgi:hypothetical protein